MYVASFRAFLETILKALPGWGWKDVVPAKTWRSTSIRLQSLSASIQIADLKLMKNAKLMSEKAKIVAINIHIIIQQSLTASI
jgi:hypothetical protein